MKFGFFESDGVGFGEVMTVKFKIASKEEAVIESVRSEALAITKKLIDLKVETNLGICYTQVERATTKAIKALIAARGL